MWNIVKASAINFGPFKNIDFDVENQCYVIQGENNTDKGEESNGAGKSNFLDLFPVSILGTSLLRGNKLKDLVNWHCGDDFFSTEVVMYNSYLDKKMEIKRTVFNKQTKSSLLYIKLNGEIPKEIISKSDKEGAVDVNDGNQFIINQIGISKEDLLSYYFISERYYTSFYKMSNTKKVDVISRFSRSSKIDEAISIVQNDVLRQTQVVNSLKSEIDTKNGVIDTYANLLAPDESSESETVDSKIAKRSKEIDEAIDTYSKQIILCKGSIETHKSKSNSDAPSINALKESLKIKEKELSDITSSGKKIKESIDANISQINETNKLLSDLELFISGEIECPNCQHLFSHKSNENVGDISIDEAKDMVNECKSIISNCEKENSSLFSQRANVSEEYRKKDGEINVINGKISSLEMTISNAKQSILDLESRIVSMQNSIDSLKQEKSNLKNSFKNEALSKKADFEKKMDDAIKQKQDLLDQLDNAEKELNKIESWISNFNDFKFFLANKPIKYIAALTNAYLEKFGSDLSIEIEGFKRLRTGKLKQELTPRILRNRMNKKSYDDFSGGQRARLNIANDLGFQEILNSTSQSGGLNHYQNDELMNPVDSLGILSAAKSFSSLSKSIFLISHSGVDNSYENIIKIVKEDSNSYIEH